MIITILLIYVFKGYYGQEGGKKDMGIGEKENIWWGLLQNRLYREGTAPHSSTLV